jgi:hypothetical protein
VVVVVGATQDFQAFLEVSKDPQADLELQVFQEVLLLRIPKYFHHYYLKQAFWTELRRQGKYVAPFSR